MAAICEIDFVNNPMRFVYTGQWLRGTIRLTLTKEENVSGVYIEFHGTAHCEYLKSSQTSNVRITYISNVEYLNERLRLLGDDESGKLLLLPGNYNYTFECMVPPDIPTSFEGKFGYIRYTASVVVDNVIVPLRSSKEFVVPFTVIQTINLNDYPQLKEPVIVERKHTFFHWLPLCSSPNLLRIVARAPIGGYKPGQIINLEINVENYSFQSVSKFSIKLMKQITYVTMKGEELAVETITLTKQKTDRGCDIARMEGIRVDMEVPQILPSDSTSDIFKVRYFIRIIGSVGIFHTNPVLDLPITILSDPMQVETLSNVII